MRLCNVPSQSNIQCRAVDSLVKHLPTPEDTDYHYGLDADLKRKFSCKWDPEKANQVKNWIETVTEIKSADEETLQSYLKSGERLCDLMNKIKPGSIKKINKGKAPFVQRENIANFLFSCKLLGMTETDLFVTVNLYEGSNMVTVVNSLFALGGLSRSVKSFSGPYLGHQRKLLESKPIEIGGSIRTDFIIRNTSALKKLQERVEVADVPALDQDLKRKIEYKYSDENAMKVRRWLEEVTGIPIEDDNLQEMLKDGTILCYAINNVKPGSVPKVHTQKSAFKMRENIANYVQGCRNLGMAETDLFMTHDLYEGRNMASVIDNVMSLSGIARKVEGYHGPTLGVMRQVLGEKQFQFADPMESTMSRIATNC